MIFSQFKALIREELFADGEAENHYEPHSRMMIDALIELQRVVPCLKEHHRTIVQFCSTYFEKGMTVIECPVGYHDILRLYTVTDDSCEVNYEYVRSVPQIIDWVRSYGPKYSLPIRNPLLPVGIVQADSSRDRQTGINIWGNRVGRSDLGIFTIHHDRIYIGPWTQSNERIVIEWSGIRRDWPDTIEIDDDPALRRAIQLWTQAEHIRLYEPDKGLYGLVMQNWTEARANLIIDCKERNQARLVEMRVPGLSISACTSCETVPPCNNPNARVDHHMGTFAVISDWGPYPDEDDTQNGVDVMRMIQSWGVKFVVSCGDNRHRPNGYQSIFNRYPYYNGLRKHAMVENRFWSAIGNHDSDENDPGDPATSMEEWINYFGYPNSGKFFDVVRGSVHMFFLDSGSLTSHTSTSPQANWLKAKLAVSQLPWKIVMVHRPPYVSHSEYSSSMRWPFKTWGADLVIAGHVHFYERLEIGDLPYIVCGWSGEKFDTPIAPIGGSQIIDNGSRGGVLINANAETLIVQAVNTAGETVDSLLLGEIPADMIELAGSTAPPSSIITLPSSPEYLTSDDVRWSGGRWEWKFSDGLFRYIIPVISDGVATNSWSDGTP